jgi:hypothetical protein
MRLRIEISPTTEELERLIFGSDEAQSIEPLDGVFVGREYLLSESAHAASVLSLAIEFGRDVAAPLFVSWLWTRIHEKRSQIRYMTVDRHVVREITEDGLRETVDEVIRSRDD